MSKMVSVRLEDELVAWLDGYAEKRGVSRTELLGSAIESFRDDCERGVPDLRRAVRELRCEPKPGECVCPVFDDGRRGFRQACPVHGGRSREDFARLTAERSELFSRLKPPASVHGVKVKS